MLSPYGGYHPHHLIYVPLNRQLHHWAKAIFGIEDVVLVAQMHNTFFGALGVALLYLLARNLQAPKWMAALGAACLLFSSGWWSFSTQIEVYVPATTCLLLLIADVQLRPARAFGWTRGILQALLLALAVLFHQTSVLFCLPLALWFWQSAGRKGIVHAVFVIGLAGLLSAGAYAWAIVQMGNPLTPDGISYFVFQYAAMDQPGWGDWHHFGPVGLFELLRSQVSMLFRQWYASRAFWVILFLLILVGIIGGNLRAQFKSRGQTPAQDPQRALRGLLLTWVGVSFLFFWWWLPQEVEFFIGTNTPLFLLALMGSLRFMQARPTQAWRKWAMPGLTALVIGTNVGNVWTAHFEPNDMALDAAALDAAAPDDCAILTDSGTEQYIQYSYRREAYNAMFVLMHYYDGRPIVAHEDPQKVECYAIDAAFLLPSFKAENGKTGYDQPREWRQYIAELFKMETDTLKDGLRFHAFSATKMGEKKAIVTVHPTVSATIYPDWEAFWTALYQALTEIGCGDKAEFLKWHLEKGKDLGK